MHQPTFSIVIPCLNAPTLASVLSALQQQTAAALVHEIIVVGRAPQHQIPHGVTFIDTQRPVAAAIARNHGAHYASGSIILFIDADCVPAPDVLERLAAAHAQGYQVVAGGVQPGSGYWRMCDDLLVFHESHPTLPPGPRTVVPSCNLSIERMLFLAHGGFDQGYAGAAGEDFDLSIRLRNAGITLFCVPQAVVTHCHGRTTARDAWQHLRGYGRAHARVVQTHQRLPGSRAGRLQPWHAPLIQAAALPLAIIDTLRLVPQPVVRRFWQALPGMAWAKIGWYWGLAEGLAIQRRSEH